MLKLKSVEPYSSEESHIDGFTCHITWKKLGKPVNFYLDFGESDRALFKIGFYRDGQIASIELLLAQNVRQTNDDLEKDKLSESNQIRGIPFIEIDPPKKIHTEVEKDFVLIIGHNFLRLIFEGDAKKDYVVKTDRVSFEFSNKILTCINIFILKKSEMQDILWKHS